MTTCAEVLRFQRFLLGSCLALVVLSFSSLALADCPEVCTCKWKGGKQTVECINASLSSIPNIEAGTQVLDLGLNYLPTLRTDTFKRNNLTNLQKIYLNQCSLRLLEVHTFRGLTNLVDLDLSNNALSAVPSAAVADCKYLMRLSLRSNPISSVGDEAFRGLHELVHLDLSGCGLTDVHAFAFRGLDSLEYLRLEANRLTTLSPTQSFPPNLRDLTLHQNRWHCDCHLLALHAWLQNFTVPNSVEPRCHSPPRLISEAIKTLSPSEFACIPKVSPTSMYLEVIEGKNMSLVCSIEAIPQASVSWKYKETEINNGSTLVNDIDMRQYYYINSASGKNRKSELFLSATTIDDNGTFTCSAANKAGQAKAEFTLHVVVPMPPKPPQDVVEERFRTEYLIAIVVAVVLLLIISLVVTTLLAMRCQRSRAKRLRAAAIESSELQRSRSAGDLSNTDTVATQMTPATSYNTGCANGSSSVHADVLDSNENNPDLLNQLGLAADGKTDAELRLSLLQQQRPKSPPPPMVPKRSTSYDIFKSKEPKLSPPTPFADSNDSFVSEALPHIIMTLPRRPPRIEAAASKGRKSLTTEVAIPPPPQYKGVHFAPHVTERRRSSGSEVNAEVHETSGIPIEGLPTRPAIPKGVETVAIQVRNNPVPLLSNVSNSGSQHKLSVASTFVEPPAPAKKQPPQPPPKTSTLTSSKVKAMAASAAGCEIVFVNDDQHETAS